MVGVTETDEYIICDAGVNVSNFSKYAVNKGYKGFEGLVGLPGTIGGGLLLTTAVALIVAFPLWYRR